MILKNELITEMMKPRIITQEEEEILEEMMTRTRMLPKRNDPEENRDFRIMYGKTRIFDDTWTILGDEPSYAMRFLLCGTPKGKIKELKKPRWYLMNDADNPEEANVVFKKKQQKSGKINCFFIATKDIEPDDELKWKYDTSDVS